MDVIAVAASAPQQPSPQRAAPDLSAHAEFLAAADTPVTEPWSPGRMVAFGSPWLSLCTTAKRPRRGVSAPGGA